MQRLLAIGLVGLAGCSQLLGLETVDPPPIVLTPRFVRSNAVAHADGEGEFSSVDVKLDSADQGDLIVVAACFIRGTIASVSDGDTPMYTLIQNKTGAGSLQAQMFWAQVATTGPYDLRVLFTDADKATSPDIRISEYHNMRFPLPIENSTLTEDANATELDLDIMVDAAPALVFAATCAGTQTIGIDNFLIREKTSPNGDAIADATIDHVGPLTVVAKQDPPGAFVLQLVAFQGGIGP